MKNHTYLQTIILTFVFIIFSTLIFGQTCENVEDFEGQPPGVLAPYNGNPGYFGDYGAPEYVAEGCPVGTGSQGVRLKASIDGSPGDGLGYTTKTGINPMPTFLSGVTYHVSGKKLLSEATIGVYTDILMTIRLSNLTNNGSDCNAPDCVIITEKILMLTDGVCESWDPPFEFVSPGDYDHMIISIEAVEVDGFELFIVLDDWCIEPVSGSMCTPLFEFFQEDCGKVQFTNLSENSSVVSWNIEGPNGTSFTYDEDNPCVFFDVGGSYSVSLTVLCDDDSTVTSETFFFDIEQDLPPFFENCEEGQVIEIGGVTEDGECIGDYTFPEIFAFDDGNPIAPSCTFDGSPAVAGQVISKPAGIYDVLCTIQDDCHEPVICFFQVEIVCDSLPPCGYTCCEDGNTNDVESLSLGSLPQNPQTGYYPEYGDPQVINDGCESSSKGIELKGVTQIYDGDAAGIKKGGFAGTELIFELGKTYCISYCMKVTGAVALNPVLELHATTSSQTDNSCNGTCEVIGTSNVVNISDGWTQQQNFYTPSADYEKLILINSNNALADGQPLIIIDNVCISESEPIFCKADFTIEDQGCGKVLMTADPCGEVESMVWLWDDGFESFESSDTTVCQEYPTTGPWSVTLIVTCADMTQDTIIKTFTTSADTIPPSLICPNDTIIYLGNEVECEAEYLIGDYVIDDTTASVTCYQSGFPIVDPSIPIILQEGLTEITYVAQDSCGNVDSCSYAITLNCDPIADPKYDCPIDVLFIMDNSGSIDASEYNSMANSALAEISAISGVYPNSKFGVAHYSGQCGNEVSIEHGFSAPASIGSINRQFSTVFPGFMDDLNESLNAVINALNSFPDPDIKPGSAPLNQTPSASLYVVIFTDGTPSNSLFPGGCTNSALLPYTNSNILKNSFNANISVVHFIPSTADAECAAIASQGGNWSGAIGTNPGDPSNPIGPRQYIPATFATPKIDLLTVIPPCEPCYNCDSLEVTFEEINSDSCCYSIDIVNGIGPDIVKLEAEIITPDWQFNTASTNPGTGYQWYPGSTPTSNKVCITGTGNVIPTGANSDVLEYCFSPSNSTPTLPQIVVFRWYSLLNDTLFELHCTDTLVTECIPDFTEPCLTVDDIEIDCNEANAYEYIVNISVTNNSGFNASHISLNGISAGFQFANCSGSAGVNSISIPIPGGLSDGASTTQCVKIIAPYPILNPELVCFNVGVYSFTDCCHQPDQVCIILDPCCDPCEDISTTYTPLSVPDEEKCCYTLELDYACDYLYFNKIKVSSITSGVTFGYHALGNPLWQMCGSSPTELCVEPISGLITKGNYPNLLDICFDEINDVSQIPQTVRIDYITVDPVNNEDSVACSQDLIFECDIVDNKCLEVTDQDIICLQDSSKYQYTFTVTNKSSLSFNATDIDVFIFSPSDLYFDPSGGTFPFTSPLGFNQSETITACIKSTSGFPSTASNIILGYRLRFNAGDTCCYESVYDTIPLPPCDDCCDDEEDFLNSISQGFQITDLGDCTYEVCANQFDSCHWFGTLGPDWGDGTSVLTAISQSNPPNNCWTHTYSQSGAYKISVQVYEGDLPANEDCWNATLCSYVDVDCEPDDCFEVVDIEMKNIVCDTTDCYENPFCQSWLIDEIANLGCFAPSTAKVEKAFYNGQPVFIIQNQAAADLSQTRIFTCDGEILQSCFIGIVGELICNPDAGIDVTTDLTSAVEIWKCGDALPIYDPVACNSGGTVVDYCVKIMNNSPSGVANFIDLQSITPPGVTVSPAVIPITLPSGGMTTINFSVSGPLYAGDIVKISGLLSGVDDMGNDFECMDTICVEIPECPQEECCTDEDEFDANLAKGFTVTQLGDCTYEVCANQFDTCHWFSNPGPDWGDGGVSLQVLTQSNPPNNCWTHTYSQSGTYTITLGVSEHNSETGEFCWGGGLSTTVTPDCCAEDPCESVDVIAQPSSTTPDSCCYDFTLINEFCDDYFKGVKIEVDAPATISQIQAMPGFVINQISNTEAEVKPLYGFIQIGAFDAFKLCNTNYTTNPHLVTISWLVPGPGGTCKEECPTEIEIGCEGEPPFDDKCFELVDTKINCDSSTYCIKIKNVSQPAFDINSIDLYDLTGSLVFSPSGRIDIPTLTHGSTSGWICVNYAGVNPGDNVCYKISAHNTPANLPPTKCCTDTIETCFTIPDCIKEECAACPAGSSQGPNLIQNGDFETGNGYSGGWSSGYNLKLAGLTGTNEYSVRNSTNLINGQWDAIDHTNNSPLGNFLTLNGPSPNIAYQVPVLVKPNTNYVFCIWVDNLVKTSTASAPIIRIDIGSNNVLPGQLLPKNPDGWQLISLNYFSGSTSGLVNIRVRDISSTQFNDWAIDDVSFKECEKISTCCDDEEDFLNSISQGFQITDLGDCTYQVCANQFDTCHWFANQGPDWGDGSLVLPAILQSDPPNNCWTHTYATAGPYKISMPVYEGDLPSDDTCWNAELCSFINVDCGPPDDCFEVVDIEMKGIVCDTSDCYENPFCQSWLVDEIASLSCFGIATASVDKAIFSGTPVFVIKQVYLDLFETRIFTCDGELLQHCYDAITTPEICNPDAGIDVTTDLTSVVQIWNCGDALPIYDPIACNSGGTVVDYCVKIMNNSPSGVANFIDLQSITPPGVTVSPAVIPITLPSGGMTTINFSVSGPLYAGDIVKISGLLSGVDDMGNDFECMDTICVEIPDCPQDECCTDKDEFDANLAKGFTVTQLGDCTYEVCANQFDTCHWFSNPGPDWGDGGVSLQVLTQSNPPNNCWTHTYSQSGTYTITIGVSEHNSETGEFCWGGGLSTTVSPDCCLEDPCESVDVIAQPSSTSPDSCCYDFTLINEFCDDYFKGVKIEVDAPATISQIQAMPGFVINQISNTEAEVMPLYGFIQIGAFDAFRLCNTNYSTNPHLVTISWLVPGPGGSCKEECPTEIEIGCEGDPPFDDKCFELVDTKINCDSSTYCIKIKNVSQPAFDINSIDLYDLTGSLVFSPSGRIDIPTLTHGSTSGWICVKYSGVNPGDNVCYKISAHNTPANLPPTKCCTDTIETCFTIPECIKEECAVCPGGATQGPNLIQNGNFETGNGYSGGWYSGYNLKLTGLMGSNNYSIRNSTNLVNGQWDAIDHTNYSSSGQFLAIDGPSSNIAYGVPVNVKPNTDYVFCMWVDNLVKTSTQSSPVIRVDIGSANVIAGQSLPKNPDGWQLISVNYNSGPSTGIVQIRVRDISSTNFNDWAIDDVSFKECEKPIDPCCTGLDTTAFCDYYDANITLSKDGCEGCVFIDLDSCDVATVDFGNGPVNVQDNIPVCNEFTGNGTYTFTVTIQRLDNSGAVCFEKDFPVSIEIDECPPISEGSCITLIEGELDCENDLYCFKVINNTSDPGFTFASIALINESTGHSFSPDPISLGGDLAQGDTSSIICVNYVGAVNGDEVCFDLVAHKEDLAAGEEPTFCCADTTRYCFEIDCPPVDGCCDITEEELCDFLDLGLDIDIDDCELCFPFEEDSCMVISIDYGDGKKSSSTGGGEICQMYDVSGIYTVNILLQRLDSEGNVCIEKDSTIEVNIEDCSGEATCNVNDFEIFNALTPNNDGLNDQLVIIGNENCPRDIKIYNRWGQMVWSESNYSNTWQGESFTGEKLPNGTYFLIVEIPFVDSKEKRMIQTFIDIRNN